MDFLSPNSKTLILEMKIFYKKKKKKKKKYKMAGSIKKDLYYKLKFSKKKKKKKKIYTMAGLLKKELI
jgi:hypothetical protein